MQVVYLYKATNTSELRYSLRSVEKYLSPDEIFIIGDKPDWIKDITHIPFKDKITIKEFNTTQKTFEILKHPEIEESFLLFSDDVFLLEPFQFKACTNGTLRSVLESRKNHNKHWKALHNVSKLFPNGLCFDTHHPYLYEKEKLKILQKKINFTIHYLFASVYYNTFLKDYEILKVKDWKIRSLESFNQMLKVQPALFSTANSVWNNPKFEEEMKKLYPLKSKYEK